MKSYATIAVKAQDLKPGDIFTGRIDETTYPKEQVVKKITIEKYGDCTDVTIETRKDKTFTVDAGHWFQREMTPYDDPEISAPEESEDAQIMAGILRLDTDIEDCAFSILDRIETHVKDLLKIRDGKIPYSEMTELMDSMTLPLIDKDFKQAAETAITLVEHMNDQEALKEELQEREKNRAADAGPYGINK